MPFVGFAATEEFVRPVESVKDTQNTKVLVEPVHVVQWECVCYTSTYILHLSLENAVYIE